MSSLRVTVVSLLALLAACGGAAEGVFPGEDLATRRDAVTVPAKGTASTLDVGSWNLEWFGDTANGPTNESLQLQNVTDVMRGADLDLWGVEEVVSTSQFNSLVAGLPGYAGFLANDASVQDGAAYYSDFSNTEQKVGLVYRTGMVSVLGAKVILTASDSDFAGRPPLEVRVRVTLNGATEDLVVIVLHAKAGSDTTSWQRRLNASNALKSYLDTTWPATKVLVIGDWNDDVDTSITAGKASPYQNFVTDSADYTYPTKALSDSGQASTVNYSDTIDHHLNTNEMLATYVAGSAEVYRVDAYVTNYGTTTSDHYPVLSRYTFGGSGGSTQSLTLTAPNGGESWAAGSSQSIGWTQSGLSSVKLEYSLDNGASWSLITASTAASSGSYTWTVPASASTQARVRVSDASGGTLNDASDAAFTITSGGTTSPANVVLHEILANEAGSNTAGEFVELLNAGGTAIDIGGWKLSDKSSLRHTFAAGTMLGAGKAIVVFGGASAIPAGLTNAVATSTGGLSLNNTGDTVTLNDAGGKLISTFTYDSSLANTDGVSMNRSPDGSATGGFVLHTQLSSLKSSPGTRADGTAF